MNYWKKTNYAFYTALEMQYSTIKPLFLIEKYMVDSKGKLNDYKFLCFNGKPYYCWVDIDRFSDHKRIVYDMNWVKQPWTQGYEFSKEEITKPRNFEQMKNIVNILCAGFPHVRVDLYNVDGKIYFGEMTFTNADGFGKFIPSEYDEYIGSLWDIPKINNIV